jgi:hypothetical protein
MRVEMYRPGKISIYGINSSSLRTIHLDYGSSGIWIDTYNKNYDPEVPERTRELDNRDSQTTFGWVPVEEAEQIAMAILIAVKEHKEKYGKN